MLNNFKLVAIISESGGLDAKEITLHQGLQETLSQEWEKQYNDFMDDIAEIDFDPGYSPEQNERFVVNNFDLPECLNGLSSQTSDRLDSIAGNDEKLESVKGLIGLARNEHNEELVLFQNFSRSHVIKPGFFLLLQQNTYQSAKHSALALDKKLSAVYLPATQKLLFRNYRNTNSFLPLADYYTEASESEIREVLEHDMLLPEDTEALAVNASQWFRKRFAMIRDSGILDKYEADEIVADSEGYDVYIAQSDGKIIVPSDKSDAKRLLQFLNEEIFRGPITETLYETNSKRKSED